MASLTTKQMQEAVSEGIDRAFTRVIMGITGMPSTDFWDMLESCWQKSCDRIADAIIEKKTQD